MQPDQAQQCHRLDWTACSAAQRLAVAQVAAAAEPPLEGKGIAHHSKGQQHQRHYSFRLAAPPPAKQQHFRLRHTKTQAQTSAPEGKGVPIISSRVSSRSKKAPPPRDRPAAEDVGSGWGE